MIYQLLHDLKRYWGDKDSLVPEEKDLLQRLTKALPTMLCERSCEQLAPGEVLVRICPDTRRQVLVCHNGDGQCACLHNGTIEEDATDVKLWLQTEGQEANGNRQALEALVDLAYNAGADGLWAERDSREVVNELIAWAFEFVHETAETDWCATDYITAIDNFYAAKKSGICKEDGTE